MHEHKRYHHITFVVHCVFSLCYCCCCCWCSCFLRLCLSILACNLCNAICMDICISSSVIFYFHCDWSAVYTDLNCFINFACIYSPAADFAGALFCYNVVIVVFVLLFFHLETLFLKQSFFFSSGFAPYEWWCVHICSCNCKCLCCYFCCCSSFYSSQWCVFDAI